MNTLQLDILAFGSHPDDVELGCAGTLAKEIAHGKKVGIIDLTRGELGTRGNAEVRDREAAKAADILGISIRENLNMRDGFFVNDEEHQLKVIQKIRQYRPDIVLCNAVDDRHIDHAKGSKLVSDASFLSGLQRVETFVDGIQQEAWRPKIVYHYIQWRNLTPDVVVDITGFMDTKMEAVLAYDSQFFKAGSDEPVTPIATKNFLDSIQYRAQDFGRIIGVDFAEGFTTERYVAVNCLTDLI
ncbi:MAG: bacillithiol biosynthesis deacetylase BshB1 [Flavobacterium sp.]